MKMNTRILTLCLLLWAGHGLAQNNANTVTISGRATDFSGNPIDSCIIELMHSDFSVMYETYTDKDGYYKLKNVEKGRYLTLYAIRPKEYPRQDAVPDEDKRLEFWAWNVIADGDLTINPRYHRLELYATNVFRVQRTNGGYMVYFRPMSLGKVLTYSKEVVLNKEKAEQLANISVKPEHLEVKVYADDEQLKVNSIQPVEEFGGEGKQTITGYIVQVDPPKVKPVKPYYVFRVEAVNTELDEKGENLYFYELKDYK